MIQRYRVLGRSVAEGDELQHVLREAYERKSPVLCECRKGTELPLYISHRQNGYVLARWPGSGARHATACDHYDAPDYLTGMGQVRGSAVLDDEASGETSLKLGFPLSRGAARLAPAALTNDKPTVKSSGQKLSMRGLLHVLWDRAELTHWHPKMAGKRTWFVVRRALLEAAASCRAKQEALPHVLFVPESFKVEEKEEIRARRRAALARVYASRDEMMVVVGEIKEIVPVHGAEKIVLRHVGDMPFVMDQDMARRFHKRFAGELALWQAQDGPNGKCGHLVLAGSFARRREGTFDLICMGAVVGYSQDTEESIRKLLRLLTPGGYLVNIEMNESLTGRFVSHRYHYRNISLARMQEVIREEGCDVTAMRFNVRHLPAKLTRAAVIAHKSAT